MMNKTIFLSSAVLMALLLVIGLTSGISKAQDVLNINQDSTSKGVKPVGEFQRQGDPIEWPSSKPVPDDSTGISPPDHTGIDSLDASLAATYDSSVRFSGAALKPRESSVEWTGAGGGGCIYASSGDSGATFNTPVYLPHGAVVKYFRMYFSDTNDLYNSVAWFTEYNLYGSIENEYSVSSSGSGGDYYATTSEITQTIDYNSYSYMINWRPYDLGSDTQVCGFRIYYKAPPGPVGYFPLVLKDSE